MKTKEYLCKIGLHNWSENHGGIRICRWCDKVDGYFGISGLLRLRFDIENRGKQLSDAELKAWWLKWDNEQRMHKTVSKNA